MVVGAGACRVHLRVRDRAAITRAGLERIVANADFGDCADMPAGRAATRSLRAG
jgi:hypothetical protein